MPTKLYEDQIAPPKLVLPSSRDSEGANSIEYEFLELPIWIILASSTGFQSSKGRSIWVHCSVHLFSVEIRENKPNVIMIVNKHRK